MLLRPWFLLSLVIAAIFAVKPAPLRAAGKPLNVVVLLADDLGAMDLGATNPATFYETPNLDRLAAQGMRFTQYYSANPVCSPSRYGMMTGKYPTRSGLTNWLPGGSPRVDRFNEAPLTPEMPLAEITLAEVLKSAGYRTALLGKWHLGSGATGPEGQGFDFYESGRTKENPRGYLKPNGDHITEKLADEAVRQLQKAKADGKPFYLQFCFYDVHIPLQARAALVEKYRAKAARLGLKDEFAEEQQYYVSIKAPRRVRTNQSQAVYAAMVEEMDHAVGRVLATLDELGLADTTLVIFASDNGGLSTAEGLPTSNLPLRGGKGWVYEGGIRVPLFVRLPGVTKPGAVSDVPVMGIDFLPTVAEAAGAALPPGLAIDGRSFLPVLRGKKKAVHDALYWHYPHYGNQGGFPGGAIRVGDWKLVENYENGAFALYNLHDDLGERHDLAAADPKRAERLRTQLHDWYREVGAKFLRAKEGGEVPWSPGR